MRGFHSPVLSHCFGCVCLLCLLCVRVFVWSVCLRGCLLLPFVLSVLRCKSSVHKKEKYCMCCVCERACKGGVWVATVHYPSSPSLPLPPLLLLLLPPLDPVLLRECTFHTARGRRVSALS